MKFRLSLSEALIAAFIVSGIGVAIWQAVGGTSQATPAQVQVPVFTSVAQSGQAAFDAHCASCHGTHAAGSDKGPPLMHDVYNPGHHADESFLRAVRNGVQPHHWPFGRMPPQPQVTDPQLVQIIRYVRELQQANGITVAPHRM